MIKDKDPNGLMDDEDVQEMMDYNDMIDEFFHDMKALTKPHHKHTWWNNIKDIFFTRAERISPTVENFCEKKMEKIFEYAYEHKLKPEDMPWCVFGFCMWTLLYLPEDKDVLKLPKEIVDYALEQFEGKRITLVKENGIYIVTFLNK